MNGPAVGVSNFNGLYFIVTVRSTFEGNLFTQELELVKRPNWHKKYLNGDKDSKLIKEEEKRTKLLKEVAEQYGGKDTDVYRYALANVDGIDGLSDKEKADAGLSDEQAAKLQKAWDSRKPVVEKTPAQKAPNKKTASTDDFLMNQNQEEIEFDIELNEGTT